MEGICFVIENYLFSEWCSLLSNGYELWLWNEGVKKARQWRLRAAFVHLLKWKVTEWFFFPTCFLHINKGTLNSLFFSCKLILLPVKYYLYSFWLFPLFYLDLQCIKADLVLINRFRFQFNDNFLALNSISLFRHFAISSFRYFAISCFKHARPKFPNGISKRKVCFNTIYFYPSVPGYPPVSAQFQALRVNSGKWNTPISYGMPVRGFSLPFPQAVNQTIFPSKWWTAFISILTTRPGLLLTVLEKNKKWR